MFLTTVRVRRARPATLDHALTTAQLQETRERRGELVELMCHGKPVAIVDGGTSESPLWIHPDLAGKLPHSRYLSLVRAAIALMDATKDAGLCEREPETV